ncbi:MAG: tetratricopeptide repeat protein [Paludibacteraceae bacterium]|nr:tetratricopeptide repeat protein [Paludibacteraceae bacterium]
MSNLNSLKSQNSAPPNVEQEDLDTLESNNRTPLRIEKWIIGCVLWLSSATLWAINNEQEQQFLYYFYAAVNAIDNEQYDKALILLDFCEQIHPQDGTTKDYLGAIYNAMGNTSRAQKYFRQAYECAPQDCWQRYTELLLQNAQNVNDSVNTKVQKRNLKTARSVLEKTVQLLPKNEDAWNMLLNAYTQSQQWKKALTAQDHIDRIVGYNTYSALTRYRIYMAWQKPKEAIQAIDDYLQYDPREYRFLLFKGDLMVQARQYVEAFVTFATIGDSLANIEQIDGAYLAYEKALELYPEHPYVLNNYAYLLATHNGDLKRAEWMSQKTIQTDPNNPIYLDTYAWILYLQGQQSLAAFYARKALEYAEDDTQREEIVEHLRQINEP